jgi:hypothetical protein
MTASRMSCLGRSVAKTQEQHEDRCSPSRQAPDRYCPHLFIHRAALVSAGEDRLTHRVFAGRACDAQLKTTIRSQ